MITVNVSRKSLWSLWESLWGCLPSWDKKLSTAADTLMFTELIESPFKETLCSCQDDVEMKFISGWITAGTLLIYLFIFLFSFFFWEADLICPIWKITDFLLLVSVSASLMDVCTRVSAAYEFTTMMDGEVKSKEHETVYTRTLYIFIHLPLMQQPQRWGSGTLCWRPNESWVIYHVESQSSAPVCVCHTPLHLLFFICFFLCPFFSSLYFFYLYLCPSLFFFLLLYSSTHIFLFSSSFISFSLFNFFLSWTCSLLSLQAFLDLPCCVFFSLCDVSSKLHF